MRQFDIKIKTGKVRLREYDQVNFTLCNVINLNDGSDQQCVQMYNKNKYANAMWYNRRFNSFPNTVDGEQELQKMIHLQYIDTLYRSLYKTSIGVNSRIGDYQWYQGFQSTSFYLFPQQLLDYTVEGNKDNLPTCLPYDSQYLYAYEVRCRDWFNSTLEIESTQFVKPYVFYENGQVGQSLCQKITTEGDDTRVQCFDYFIQEYARQSLIHKENNTSIYHVDDDNTLISITDLEFYATKAGLNDSLNKVWDIDNFFELDNIWKDKQFQLKFEENDSAQMAIFYPISIYNYDNQNKDNILIKNYMIIMVIGQDYTDEAQRIIDKEQT
ncbi:hypothetical protein PPERSA_00981 [Pseudocohnilembus persalinus]|uniref:Uncharacterized protein n=1 Tax=Pseudocohnilembus persalinus TaxID=266149 RepID=A0A0V0R8J2_PSEPJ|nr:hypothetical protein PPERSA_00981 [Pseudocohnilembus persalinus]|eukprot:KRX10811.1 hypothetical protein PPERSA_00981 [Pseudocohnilembus persalinus]